MGDFCKCIYKPGEAIETNDMGFEICPKCQKIRAAGDAPEEDVKKIVKALRDKDIEAIRIRRDSLDGSEYMLYVPCKDRTTKIRVTLWKVGQRVKA